VALPVRGVLEIRSADTQHVVAVYHPLVLAYFTRPPSEGELNLLRDIVKDGLANGVRGGTLFVVARRDATGGIQPRVRAFFEQMVRDNAGRFGASAAVVLMKGFGGALIRGFLAGLVLLGGRRDQLQVFGDVEAACQWLAPRHEMNAKDLLGAYRKATAGVVTAAVTP
jgi:hypothetical protein